MRTRFRNASIDLGHSSLLSDNTDKSGICSFKNSNLNNFWQKCLDKKKRLDPVKADRKILVWRKETNSEKRRKFEKVLANMTPHNAEIIKKLYRSKFLE